MSYKEKTHSKFPIYFPKYFASIDTSIFLRSDQHYLHTNKKFHKTAIPKTVKVMKFHLGLKFLPKICISMQKTGRNYRTR